MRGRGCNLQRDHKRAIKRPLKDGRTKAHLLRCEFIPEACVIYSHNKFIIKTNNASLTQLKMRQLDINKCIKWMNERTLSAAFLK